MIIPENDLSLGKAIMIAQWVALVLEIKFVLVFKELISYKRHVNTQIFGVKNVNLAMRLIWNIFKNWGKNENK